MVTKSTSNHRIANRATGVTDETDSQMRLGNFDCGCDDRRFIMFEAGKLGLKEAAFLAAVVMTLVIARKVGP
jgi:hypothetical protein